MTNHRRHTIAVPHVLSLSRKSFREDRGNVGIGEAEAGLGGGEGCGELWMILSEVLRGNEDVVIAGGVEPVADGEPEVAGHERVDEAQLREGARRGDEWNELEVCLNVVVGFCVARDDVLLPLRRRIGGRLKVEELPARLEIREPFGVHDQSSGGVEGRGRIDDRAVDKFAVVGVHV